MIRAQTQIIQAERIRSATMKATRYFQCAAAASVVLLPSTTHAFSVVTQAHHMSRPELARTAYINVPSATVLHETSKLPQVRLHSSRRNYDWDPDEDKSKEKNLLEKGIDAVKSVLPTKWFQSEEQKRAAIEKKRQEEEITGSLDQVFKDAPLGVRLMGKMAGKVVSKMASGVAEQMRESSRQLQDSLDDARAYIAADGLAREMLGEPIEVGMPFSQSSSTSIINGQKSVNIQASFEVRGSRGSGMATMVANDSGIERLQVNAGGRVFEVSVSTSGSPRASVSGTFGGGGSRTGGSRNKGKGDIIDAEIIDAEYTEKK